MTDRRNDAARPGERPAPGDEPASAPAPTRRSPRRGGPAADDTSSAAVPEPAAEEPAGVPAPVPPRGEPPAGSAPTARDRVPALLAAIVGFALLTSLIALGATIAIGRTLAAAGAERERAADRADALARVPAIVRALDAATARLEQSVPPPAVAPATAADVRAAIDGLRDALADHRPAGIAPIAGTLREGFSTIDARLSRIEARLDARAR